MSSTITIQLDPEVAARLKSLAAAQNRLPEAVLREALAAYLDRLSPATTAHSEDKRYPARNPVGGIITPV